MPPCVVITQQVSHEDVFKRPYVIVQSFVQLEAAQYPIVYQKVQLGQICEPQ